MPEPTLQELFGANANQTASVLTISKADLQAKGLTPSATNTAESLFVAILLYARDVLTQTNQNNNPDQSIVVTQGNPLLTTRNNITYKQVTFSLSAQKVDNTSTVIDPDDY